MTWLITGIAIFATTHLAAAALPALRDYLQTMFGPNTYRAVFSILAIAGIVLIVVGWRSTVPIAIYAPPAWGTNLAFLLMLAAVILFGASHAKTNIKRFVRHPQLTSILLWSLAHIASNGDSRSLILFGSFGVWAALEMTLISHRDGEWQKPERATAKSEAIGAAISIVIFLVLIALHPYFAGVSPLP